MAVKNGLADLATALQVLVRPVQVLEEVRMEILVDFVLTYAPLLHLELFVLRHQQREEAIAFYLLLNAGVPVIHWLLTHHLVRILASALMTVGSSSMLVRIRWATVGPLLGRVAVVAG